MSGRPVRGHGKPPGQLERAQRGARRQAGFRRAPERSGPLPTPLTRKECAHVSARRNDVSAPYAARRSPNIEKIHIRFDDPIRVYRLGARGTEAIRNPLRRPKDLDVRQSVAIRRETADDNRSRFGAGTQPGGGAGLCKEAVRRSRPAAVEDRRYRRALTFSPQAPPAPNRSATPTCTESEPGPIFHAE